MQLYKLRPLQCYRITEYNFIERRMTLLSASIAGVVLPHDQSFSQLNDFGKTTVADCDRKTFKKPGEVFCDLWNMVNIDNHSMKCYHRNQTDELNSLAENWVHQYFHTMAFRHLKPIAYKQVEVPWLNLSIRSKTKLKKKSSSRYQCDSFCRMGNKNKNKILSDVFVDDPWGHDQTEMIGILLITH